MTVLLNGRPLRRIHNVIDPWVSASPDAPALLDRTASLTYRQLHEAVEGAAQRLGELGVRPGDRVLVVCENCVAVGVLLLALSRLDAWAVVVNARLSPREIDTFAEHSGARRVIYTPDVSLEAGAHARRVGAKEEFWPLTGRLNIGPLNGPAVAEQTHTDPAEQVAVMIYTSGTSGSPKGVMLTHSNLLFISEVARSVRLLSPQDTVYGVLPMAHVVGLSSQLLGALACGSKLFIESRYSAEALADAILKRGATVFVGVPAMFSKLLEWSRANGVDISRHQLRSVGAAGSPLTPELKAQIEAAMQTTLQNSYGLTETSPTICQTLLLSAPRNDCSVGPPVPGVEVRMMGSDGRDVARGEVGELWVRGPNVMKGYYRASDLTAESIQDGWFNTRDLARQGEDGGVFIMGRTRELIIRSGFNVFPVEVEQAINSYPGVVQSAVIGRPAEGNEQVIAYVEPEANVYVDTDDLDRWVRQQLAPYKVPAEIHVIEKLPAAPTGKVLKGNLRELDVLRSAERRATHPGG
ncbi:MULTISPECIES: class I adenylate-forming enzyme family protein [Paraburkholderia]|uniref:AMP-binding protein n=1 Tax=Paraburkholderia dipogonis TaxID=1211383 RepID=A0ABW9B861_9BURK